MFNQEQFLSNLKTLVGFKTIVCQNKNEFIKANAWIKSFFDPEKTEFIEIECNGLMSLIIKPRDSLKPNVLGDGHIEVVPGDDDLFELKEEGGYLYGRGVADMKTQCLMMMAVLRKLIDEGNHNDFWLLFSEDEEVGSANGVKIVLDYLSSNNLLPKVVFAPDGGPDFAYVEKEKGIMSFSVTIKGKAAHASRPFLGDNAIHKMVAFYAELQRRFPNPKRETDWVASLSMTKISSGEAINKIPDRCKASFDVRLTEQDELEDVVVQIEKLGRAFEAEITFHQKDIGAYAFTSTKNCR